MRHKFRKIRSRFLAANVAQFTHYWRCDDSCIETQIGRGVVIAQQYQHVRLNERVNDREMQREEFFFQPLSTFFLLFSTSFSFFVLFIFFLPFFLFISVFFLFSMPFSFSYTFSFFPSVFFLFRDKQAERQTNKDRNLSFICY